MWRFLLAALLLAGIAVVTRAPWPRGRRAWRDLVVTGVLLQGVQFGAAYGGVALGVPAGWRRSCCASRLRWSRRRPARCWASGWAARAGGARGSRWSAPSWRAGTTSWRAAARSAGLGLLALGLVGFASGTLYQKRTGATMDLRTGTAVQLLAGAVAVLPVALVTEHGLPFPTGGIRAGRVRVDRRDELRRGAVLLFVLLRRGTGAGVSGLLYLVPPVTAVLAVPVLGQPLEPLTVVGIAVTLVGVVLVNRSGRPQGRDAADSAATSASVSVSERVGSRSAS